jgi:cytochrome c2
MPATEQTWRNIKILHVIFGASALAMLLTTVWMLAADHNREAKGLQKKFNLVETQQLEWRKTEQLTGDFEKKRKELDDKLATERAKLPPKELITKFDEIAAAKPENGYNVAAVDKAYAAFEAGAADPAKTPEEKGKLRDALTNAMQRVVDRAAFIENESQRKLKFQKADLDVDMSALAIEIDENRPPKKIDETQDKVSAVRKKVEDDLTVIYQQNKTHRLALQDQLNAVKANEEAVRTEITKHEIDVKRTETAIGEKAPNAGKWFLELPILDAFGGPLKPQQYWLPDLTWNNNFRNVARFDRCNTCHQGIDKTAPGSAVDPAYHAAKDITVQLETPKTEPSPDDFGKPLNERLRSVYGMVLSGQGLFNPDDVTIEAVFSGGLAIRAGLRAGDVIRTVGGVQLTERSKAAQYLLQSVTWGKPLTLGIRRGVPHPYAGHPRLDLFVGSMSPHKVGDFGCTICHEGQGNGTSFKWVSHTPNDPEQAARWGTEWGWFNNHHWIYPMLPQRFQEANCLKCHHEVTELKPSRRFPEPPAPKLVAGFETIQDVGCFGCHEINGYDGPSKRRGPDLRAEPNYTFAAEQVLSDKALTAKDLAPNLREIAELARKAADHPESTPTRKLLAELITADAKGGADGKAAPVLSTETRAMATILGADDETPGQYRKVGPSLRYVKYKNTEDFLFTWIKEPKSFRPSTKMPQFFGLYDHLKPAKRDDAGNVILDGHGHAELDESTVGLKDAQRFEPIEIAATTKYLLMQSQPFAYLDKAKGAEAPSAERGKVLFQTRGCLACHTHRDFPGIAQNQGPNLSGLGSKFINADGKQSADAEQWLYTWLKQPNKYHNRTTMPVLFLDVIKNEVKDAQGNVTSSTSTDPAADIVAYLLGQKEIETGKPWSPEKAADPKIEDIDDLMTLYLNGAFTKAKTKEVIKNGIRESERSSLKGDEQLLITDGGLTKDQKLIYLGKKTIGRLGCAGCHDVPGFEDSKPIGTGLADWGRKESSKLAFEQVAAYLSEKEAHGHNQVGPPDLDKGFFLEAMAHHQREGFIWQKLREPRSYDYKKTENKSYIDRLRMPQFNLNDEQREAIMTFVLGLVSEPPAAKYVYHPSPKQEAILAGRRVLDKFNCAGCHALEMQRWEMEYKPGSMPAPSLADEYAFLVPHYTPEQIAKSKQVDRRGLGHAQLHGLPLAKEDEEEPTVYFKLWSPTLIDGQTWLSGGTDVGVDEKLNPPKTSVRYPQVGGVLANYLHPVALNLEKKNNPNVKASDVWGFVPPPLVREGNKVQTQWLHDFLLDPYPIRPSVVLRMPKFNMTSAESEAIVGHFAALDGAEYPYEFDRRTRSDYLTATESWHPNRMEDALKLITDNNYCIKCHKLGDFAPNGAPAALAPNLADVYRRLRPEYLRDWIANPARLLPYTGMPVNFPKNKPADQKLFHGSSEEQVQAVVDFLLNYDEVMKGKTSIKPLIKPAAPASAPTAGGGN